MEYCSPSSLLAIEDRDEMLYFTTDKERLLEVENYLDSFGMKVDFLSVMDQKTYFEIHTILPPEFKYGNQYSKDEVKAFLLAMRPYIYGFPVGKDERIEGTIAVGLYAENSIQYVGFIDFVYTANDREWNINIGV